jgi:hypothetical protein
VVKVWPTNETIQETPTFEDLPPESITPSPIIEEIAVSDKESPVDRVLSSETSELSFLPTLEALPPEPFLWLPTGLSRMDERELSTEETPRDKVWASQPSELSEISVVSVVENDLEMLLDVKASLEQEGLDTTMMKSRFIEALRTSYFDK